MTSTRVLMVVENNPFPDDPRVRHEAAALRDSGRQVSVIAPRRQGQHRSEVVDGITVHRYRPGPTVSGPKGYAIEYGIAAAKIALMTLRLTVRDDFDVIHFHNPPDALVAVGSVVKRFGKLVVFDHHDAAPEMYLAMFGREDPVHRALLRSERMACRSADLVLSTNDSMKQLVQRRAGVAATDVHVVRNGPDLDGPTPRSSATRPTNDPPVRLCYVGSIGFHDGLDHLVRSLNHLRSMGTPFQCVIVGDGPALIQARELVSDLDLNNVVTFAGHVRFDAVASHIAAADICLAPEPENGYNELCTVIKLMEYMSFGKPTVAFDLSEHRVSAGDAAMFARPNDEADFARCIRRLAENPDLCRRLGAAGRARIADGLSWQHQVPALLAAYDQLESRLGDSTIGTST